MVSSGLPVSPVRRGVLVVDDDPALLAVLRDHLAGDGWDVVTVNGAAAARAALDCGIDVVPADLIMDDGDALALIGEARSAPGTPPVVVKTEFGTLDTETAATPRRRG